MNNTLMDLLYKLIEINNIQDNITLMVFNQTIRNHNIILKILVAVGLLFIWVFLIELRLKKLKTIQNKIKNDKN